MGAVTMTQCDHCKKMVEKPYAERGWIQFNGGAADYAIAISRSHGIYGPSSYRTDFLERISDFCSIECLVAALDAKRDEAPGSKP